MTMKYKIGDVVRCYVETRPSGIKSVLSKGIIDKSNMNIDLFQIIYIDKEMATYTILIPNAMLGWIISDWHVMYQGIAKAFVHQKFWEITDGFVFGKN